MITTTDIYIDINESLTSKDYYNVNIDMKKELINQELKNYAISKITELNYITLNRSDSMSYGQLNKLNINELLNVLATEVPVFYQYEILCHFIKFLLEEASFIQEREITWCLSWEPDFIEQPIVKFDNNNLWIQLKSHPKTNHLKTFDLVNEVFNNHFITKETSKRLIKKRS